MGALKLCTLTTLALQLGDLDLLVVQNDSLREGASRFANLKELVDADKKVCFGTAQRALSEKMNTMHMCSRSEPDEARRGVGLSH
jgi:hypothetical protein